MRHDGFFIGLLACSIALGAAEAAVWRVEKDGSGDFTVIQQAVNAAASGDTVVIGPGLFDEGELHVTPVWTEYVRVLVTVSELTMIGSGDDTIIGQEEAWNLEQGRHKGIVAYAGIGSGKLRVENICFKNMGEGVYVEYIELELVECLFQNNWYSNLISGAEEPQTVVGCRYENIERDGIHLHSSGSRNLTVVDCRFSAWDYQPSSQVHMNFSGVTGFLVEGCEFYEADGGTIVSLGSSGTIRDCLYDGQAIVGTDLGPGSTLLIENCTYRNQAFMTELRSSTSNLTVRGTLIESVADCSFLLSSVHTLSVQDCDLAVGNRGAVWANDCSVTPAVHVDFTQNFWGTVDPEAIADLIHDRNDSGAVCRFVDFEPFRTESTPTEPKSLSDLKGLFR